MPIVRIDLDTESFERLADSAIAECRPVSWQAEVLLKRALGISTPCPLPRVTVKASPFNMVTVVRSAWLSTHDCRSGTRLAEAVSVSDREDVCGLATDAQMMPVRAARAHSPRQTSPPTPPSAARASLSACRGRCGEPPTTAQSPTPRHAPAACHGRVATPLCALPPRWKPTTPGTRPPTRLWDRPRDGWRPTVSWASPNTPSPGAHVARPTPPACLPAPRRWAPGTVGAVPWHRRGWAPGGPGASAAPASPRPRPGLGSSSLVPPPCHGG